MLWLFTWSFGSTCLGLAATQGSGEQIAPRLGDPLAAGACGSEGSASVTAALEGTFEDLDRSVGRICRQIIRTVEQGSRSEHRQMTSETGTYSQGSRFSMNSALSHASIAQFSRDER